MSHARIIAAVILSALLAMGASDPAGSAPTPEPERDPLDLGLQEEVEVQLVLVDFVVLDRDGRTVPDLTVEDLALVINMRDIPIRSLDRDCPVGAADDPLPGKRSGAPAEGATLQPRRFVLVFDYYHMTNVAETFERAGEMLDKWSVGGEEHMVVSLGGALRVEAPFTADREEIRATLRRMLHDRDLYAGTHGRLTERPFFDRMEMLFDVMERIEGRKTIVLFSGPFIPDGFYRDPELKRLSALATATRTAVYPVDTGGLRTPLDPLVQPFGGPGMLRRLANETGGRMTAQTNEIGLAYAKAHRDLGCTYTLGFHDPGPIAHRKRRLTIRVKDRRGLRVVYPEFYVVRSPEQKRKSLFRTAATLPGSFESDALRTDLFLLAPHSASRWQAVAAIDLRPGPDVFVEEGEEWILRGLVRRPNGTVVHSFKQRVPMPATDPETGVTPAVRLFRPLRVRPGDYRISAVLSDPDASAPLAATRRVVVAEIPRDEPLLVGPILGRSVTAGSPRGDGHPWFEPLLVPESERGQSLEAMTVLCTVGRERPVDRAELRHVVGAPDDSGLRRLEPVSASLEGEGAVRCHRLVDPVETATLEPGLYRLTAVAETSDGIVGRNGVEFTVLPAALN